MRLIAASLVLALIAGGASAQLIPLGTPLVPQPKAKASPSPFAQDQDGRLHAARPLGSNYSPYSLQPQGAVTAAAPSSLPMNRQVASGVVNDPNAPNEESKTPAKPSTAAPSDLQKLAPKAAERTEMPTATPDASPSAPR